MRKVLFEYRKLEVTGKDCRFIATHEDGRVWEMVVDMPYKFGEDFWSEDPYSVWVTRTSRRIAREYNAPDWVME